MTEGKTGLRLRILAGLVAFLFAALTARLWFLQVLAADDYRRQAQRNGVQVVPEEARRGRVLDRRGRELVTNRMSLLVTIDRSEVSEDELEPLLFELASELGVEVSTLLERYRDDRYDPFSRVPVAADLEPEVAFRIAEDHLRFEGVEVRSVPVREYAADQLLAELAGVRGNGPYPGERLGVHLLGYAGEISPEELEQAEFAGYEAGDRVGKSGIERRYEPDLRGTDGSRALQVNVQGRVLRELERVPPIPGNDVVLSIDAETQALVEESLRLGVTQARAYPNLLPAVAGAAVVMDPNNGQVLALASFPNYEPSLFLGPLPKRKLEELQSDARHRPLFNRAIAGQYNPASTFKPFMALSAMHDGIRVAGRPVSPSSFLPCPGYYIARTDRGVNDHRFYNWEPFDHGYISLQRSLVESCDTTFYPMGDEYWRIWRDSDGRREPLQRNLRLLGFGRPTLIDLPYEQTGVVPDNDWKRAFVRRFGGDPIWYPGDMINMSIGAGDMLVTPLQAAVAYSAVANGGTVYAPRVALRVQEPDGDLVRRIRPRVVGHLPFSLPDLAFVRQALRGVVGEDGTAASAFAGFPLHRVPVGGKTGTADPKANDREDHSWFAAMAPVDEPRYVVVAIVEEAGFGSVTAAPVVRRILEGLFDLPIADLHLGEAAD
jgi:penicillin-binding protein 2